MCVCVGVRVHVPACVHVHVRACVRVRACMCVKRVHVGVGAGLVYLFLCAFL